jgi:hypothetical protein
MNNEIKMSSKQNYDISGLIQIQIKETSDFIFSNFFMIITIIQYLQHRKAGNLGRNLQE